jgi:hypothetical protein
MAINAQQEEGEDKTIKRCMTIWQVGAVTFFRPALQILPPQAG